MSAHIRADGTAEAIMPAEPRRSIATPVADRLAKLRDLADSQTTILDGLQTALRGAISVAHLISGELTARRGEVAATERTATELAAEMTEQIALPSGPVIIWGEQGSGKTRNADTLMFHYGKRRVIDEWEPGTGGPLPNDALVITTGWVPGAIYIGDAATAAGIAWTPRPEGPKPRKVYDSPTTPNVVPIKGKKKGTGR